MSKCKQEGSVMILALLIVLSIGISLYYCLGHIWQSWQRKYVRNQAHSCLIKQLDRYHSSLLAVERLNPRIKMLFQQELLLGVHPKTKAAAAAAKKLRITLEKKQTFQILKIRAHSFSKCHNFTQRWIIPYSYQSGKIMRNSWRETVITRSHWTSWFTNKNIRIKIHSQYSKLKRNKFLHGIYFYSKPQRL